MSDDKLDVGTQLGQYIVGEPIAEGGMAQVYHANCLMPGRYNARIVLKRMHKRLADDASFVSMFVEEARILSRLDHPNIVSLFDFEATSDGLYIILELVEGPDLLSLLRGSARQRRVMPQELAVYICCHILEALDYAHALEIKGRPLGIVHQDVSPGNVLISKHGRVKLADFGIAKANDRQQGGGQGTLRGKYGYMSPEQLEGKELDGRSDVFSVAIVLSELLMSKRLFSATNPLDVLLMVRNVDLTRLEKNNAHIDPQLLFILGKGLLRNREERYTTAGEFRDDLAEWLSSRKQRTNATTLQKYIAELEAAGFIAPPKQGEGTSSMTLSGATTQARSKAARGAALLGMKAFELGPSGGLDAMALGAGGVTSINSRPEVLRALDKEVEKNLEPTAGRSAAEALAEGKGELKGIMPMDLIGAISASGRTGLLTLERDEVLKEAYFRSGDPIFVGSNDPHERFGNFLVLRGLLTGKELEGALTAMPHFGGRLGQSLVGLKLLKPVDALNLLAEQVGEKLLRACCWNYGRFVWEEDKENPHESVSLRLSSAKIVARGVRSLDPERLGEWIEARKNDAPDFAKHAPYEVYDFGPSLTALLSTMDGGRTIDDVLSSVSAQSKRVLSAAIYALAVSN
jgi:serine/threonine protein kinase